MTIETFRKNIKKRNRIIDFVNYLKCTAIVVLGLYFLYIILNEGFNKHNHTGNYWLTFLSITIISVGLYGIWRIPKSYMVTIIYSSKKIEGKLQIINEYLSQVKIVTKKINLDVLEYRYKNKFFNRVDLYIFVDDDKVLFNAQGVDPSGIKGIIDFGLTRRATRKLKKYLNACL